MAMRRPLPAVPLAVGQPFIRWLSARLVFVVLVFGPVPIASAYDSPTWQVDASAFEATMNVTAVILRDGFPSARPGDRVAAFVHDVVTGAYEIRGVADATTVGGNTMFFLTVYANADGETMTFRHYVASEDRVYRTQESLVFRTNGQSGTVADPVRWSMGEVEQPRPGWVLDPAAFGASMRVTAMVTLDQGTPTILDQVAAFSGNTVRGVAFGTTVAGRTMFFLTVYGQSQGEEITFRFHDQSTDLIHPIAQTVLFGANSERGSISSPMDLVASSASQSTGRDRGDAIQRFVGSVSVFPNPASTIAQVEVRTDRPRSTRVRIVDLLGRTVTMPADLDDGSFGRLAIDVSGLAAATYLVVVETPFDRSVHPLVVNRTR